MNEVDSKMRENNLLVFFFLLSLLLLSPFVRLWSLRLRPTLPALLLQSWPLAAAADCFALARRGCGFAGTLTSGSSPVHSSPSDDALLLRSWPFAAAADCFAVARQGRGFAGTLTTGSSPFHLSSSDDGDDSRSEGASFSDGDECASRAKGDFCF